MLVTGVTPVVPPYYVTDPTQDGTDGYTTFLITFNPDQLPSGAASGISNYTGTYSYAILPDNRQGATPTAISAPIWSYDTVQVPQGSVSGSLSPNVPIASYGPGGTGTNFDLTESNITLAAPANDVVSGITVTINIADPVNNLGELGDLFIGLIDPAGNGAILYYKPGDPSKNLTNVTFSDRRRSRSWSRMGRIPTARIRATTRWRS